MSSDGLTISGPRNPIVPPPDGETPITLYGYIPSLALGIVAVVAFALVVLPNFWYLRKGRTYWTFHICLIIGCLAEIAGYGARIHSHFNPFRVDNFVTQFLCIILAPIAFTASIDLTLNMLVKGFPNSDGILLLRPKLVLIIFVTTDAISNIVQVAGGTLFGLSQSGNSDGEGSGSDIDPELGQNVLRAGLALQVASWVIFIAFLSVAIYRSYSTTKNPHLAERRYDPLRWYLLVVLTSCIFILWRACFRLAEAITGFVSGPLTREDFFGCFEFLPIILCLITLTVLPPYRFIQHPRARSSAESEKRFGSGPDTPPAFDNDTPRASAV